MAPGIGYYFTILRLMHNTRRFQFAILLAIFFDILPHIANADKLPELKRGMSQYEVVQTWGSPKEKVEYETKRKDEWIYAAGKAVFENGKLINWYVKDGETMVSQTDATPVPLVTAVNDPKNMAVKKDVVDDILSEIMKDPSNNDPADRTVPGMPVAPPVPPPVQPMAVEPVVE